MPAEDENEQPNVGEQDGSQDASGKNAGKAQVIGKKLGSANYKPIENKKMIEIAEELNISSSEGEKDKIWPIFVNRVAAELKTTPRTATAGSEHLKEMVKVVRSISSAYSMHARDTGIQCPEDKDDEEFETEFTNYAECMYDWVTNLPKATLGKTAGDFKPTWWDKSTFTAARLYVLNLDLALTSSGLKDKVAASKSKMEEENDEKKRLAEERKRGLEKETAEKSEMHKKICSGMDTLSTAAENISKVLVTYMTPTHGTNTLFVPPVFPDSHGNDDELNNTKQLVDSLEKRMEKMESTMDKVSGNIAELLAMMKK